MAIRRKTFTKYREGRDTYEVRFDDVLAAGDELKEDTPAPTVTIEKSASSKLHDGEWIADGPWEDATSEFIDDVVNVVDGTKLQFELKAAAAGEQLASECDPVPSLSYRVVAIATTNADRIVVAKHELVVKD